MGPKMEISYHYKDIVSKSLTEVFVDQVLDFYGIYVAPIVRAEPANLPIIEVREKTMDYIFYLVDDSYLHLEFQSSYSREDLERFMEYDVAHYSRNKKRIQTCVIYGAGIKSAKNRLDNGSVLYRTEVVFMEDYDGDRIFDHLFKKVETGEKLSRLEQMQLAFIPLMRTRQGKGVRAREAVELVARIPEESQRTFLTGCIIAFSEKFLEEEYVDSILEEVSHMSRVFQELEDRARNKGMVEGKLQGKIEGELENKIAVTKKMLLRGISIKEIAEITELPEEQVQRISKEM